MRIGILGAGPAGLYFALLMKKADPSHHVLVIERNPPDATFGWGVVFSEETLGALRDADGPTHDAITETFARWGAIDVRYRGQTVRSRGHGFSAIARKRLLQILQERCRGLGVELEFHRELGDLSAFEGCDLVVGADGVNSFVRQTLADRFRPSEDVHRTRFAWFGTDLVFDAFTFIFREDDAGLFQVHAYPFDADTSTFIVECPEATWRRAGLDAMDEGQSIAYCQSLFAPELHGHRLLSNRSLWTSFVTLRCDTWRADNVVLLGDAAHTAHFTIGSGTKLAMEDAVALSQSLQRHAEIGQALVDYELERLPVVERFQEAARESATYFENVRRYASFTPLQFAFNLLTRSGRITHLELEKRDAAFVRAVDAELAAGSPSTLAVAPPPFLTPSRSGRVEVANRVALSLQGTDDAIDGIPSDSAGERLAAAAGSGASLLVTELVAVGAEARVTPGTPGLFTDAQERAWAEAIHRAHGRGPVRIALRLGHAGRRGATRPRRDGVDRPLPVGRWPLVAPSPIPYTRFSQEPVELDGQGIEQVVGQFAEATARAAGVGFDLVLVDLAHGYLAASFLSPLSNRRADRFGGDLSGRMRFPLAVMEAVRSSWPKDLPLGAILLATDWVPGGFEVDDGVAVAGALKERGCDLILPSGGQTMSRDDPQYGRFSLVPAADRIRNEAGVATMAGGNITTNDEINTIVAAGRADLCVLDLPGR